MSPISPKRDVESGNYKAVVLVITLVMLVVLASLAYMLASRLAVQRHRDQYIIDYQAARYACDSGLKYAMTTIGSMKPVLAERPNEPDFSDIFRMTKEEYEQFMMEWTKTKENEEKAEEYTQGRDEENIEDQNESPPKFPFEVSLEEVNLFELFGLNDYNELADSLSNAEDINKIVIRGPYGPPWPLATEPVEFAVGSATVTIEVIDENAKMPLVWGLLNEKEVQREAHASLETFCEWMQMSQGQIEDLKSQLKQISEIKQFQFEQGAINITKTVQIPVVSGQDPAGGTASRRRARRYRRQQVRQIIETRPAVMHTTDFAKLFHSSAIDTTALAMPIIEDEGRSESAMKYLGMWGSQKVNINTAPRHVLEATFTFGGDAVKIAEAIIQRRRIRPFADMGDLTKSLYQFSDSIKKTERYITTESTFFTIRVTGRSGAAQSSVVAAIIKDGGNVQKIGIISE